PAAREGVRDEGTDRRSPLGPTAVTEAAVRGAPLKLQAASSDTRIDGLHVSAPKGPPARTGNNREIGRRPAARADLAGRGMLDRKAVRWSGAFRPTSGFRNAWRQVEHHPRNRKSAHVGGRARDRATRLSRSRGSGVPPDRLPALSTVLRRRTPERTWLRPGGGTFVPDALQPSHHLSQTDGAEHARLRSELRRLEQVLLQLRRRRQRGRAADVRQVTTSADSGHRLAATAVRRGGRAARPARRSCAHAARPSGHRTRPKRRATPCNDRMAPRRCGRCTRGAGAGGSASTAKVSRAAPTPRRTKSARVAMPRSWCATCPSNGAEINDVHPMFSPVAARNAP